MIELRALGRVELRSANQGQLRAVLAQPKRLALLVYLAVEGHDGSCRRDTLVSLFWPELDTSHARGALRQALSFLRRSLGADLLDSRGDEEVAIRPEALWCDASAFEQAIARAEMTTAIELYRGDLLTGLFVTDASPEFEQWLDGRRERLRANAVRAANALVHRYEGENDLARAEIWARRVTELAPDDERAVRRLMELLVAGGDTAGAQKVFVTFERRLARELDSQPSNELSELSRLLRQRSTNTPARPSDGRAVAVLPFRSLGRADEEEHLADGMTEEIRAALGRVSVLRVASRSAALAFRDKRPDLRTVRRELGVDVLVDGSVHVEGTKLRVNAALTNVADGFQLWSGTYERERDHLFAIRDEIARSVVAAMASTFAGRDLAPPRPPPTRDVEAYNLYLKGRFYWNKRPRDTTGGIDYFERAIARDPRFALAHAALADAYNTLGSWEGGVLAPRVAFTKAQAAALRALELDPALAEAHTALGYTSTHYLWQWDEAEERLRHAIALDPRYPHTHHWYSHHLIAMGRLDESLQESERCLALEPLDIIINIHLAWHYWLAHQYEAGLDQAQRTQELDPYDSRPAIFLGFLYGAMGRHGEAIAAHQRGLALADGSAVLLAALGQSYAAAGKRREAEGVLRELRELSAKRYISAYEVAVIHAALGEVDLAFDWLDRAHEERSAWLPYLATEPRLDPLRGDPRFAHLVAKLGLARAIPPLSDR